MAEDTISLKKLKISAITISILGLFFKFCYRNIVYKNNIFDWGIADSAPNFFFSMFIPCIIIYYRINQGKFITNTNIRKVTFFSMLGILAYEFEQNFTNMTFDYGDVIATILGSLLIFFILIKIFKNKK